jgi:hypothetical protein
MVLGAYQRPREKKPSSASTRITIRMIQRMLMRFDASLRGIRVVDLVNCFRRDTTKNLAGRVRGDLEGHPGSPGLRHSFVPVPGSGTVPELAPNV